MTVLLLVALALDTSADLLDRIYSAPPEIAANILLRNLDKDRAKRGAQLEEVFRLAGQAKMPFPVMAQANSDTLAGKQMEARLEQLDGLSLQVRAVRSMISVNPQRALEMAIEMPVPAPPLISCKDASVAQLDQYYGLVLDMARRGFTAKQREDGEHLQYMLRVIYASIRPEQLQGATALVRTYEGPEEEMAALYAALASSLRAASANPRAFASTPALAMEMEALQKRARSPVLDEALAAYLKTQRSEEACGPAENFQFWENGESREISKELSKLRPAPAKPDADWESRYTAALHRVESWLKEDETPAMAHFHMKALAFRSLLEASATDDLLGKTVASFIAFLKDAPAKMESPAEWMIHFRRATAPWAPGGPRSTEIARQEIRRGGDAVMNLLLDAKMTW